MFKLRNSPNVIKLSTHIEMMANEIKSLVTMEKQRKSKGVTKILDYGLILVKNFDESMQDEMLASYYVMPKYSKSLQQALRERDLDQDEVWTLAQILIDCLRTVHKAGRIYNDMKPENIMLGNQTVTLIDFGLCSKYIDPEGNHIS